MFPSKRILLLGALALLLTAVVAGPAFAQAMPGEGMAAQSLRPYRFVFIAYAIAWALVLGWVVSVSVKLARLTRRLED